MSRLRGLAGRFAFLLALVFLSSVLNTFHVSAQQDALCSADSPCKVGCCSSSGVCGFTKAHCGDGCQSNCNATAECGQYAVKEAFDCPINVCCSQYGFCGITEDFCGDGCQPNSDKAGCGVAQRPAECPVNTDALTYKRRIAYYELFTRTRSCNVKEPESLPLGPLTHLNLAFVNFGSDFKLIDDDSDWVRRTVLRKIKYPDLRINIAIGGWTFNDPPTSTYFSDMVGSYDGRATFIKSVCDYLRTYGLDGVDIDWEYPGATDRGGGPRDDTLYVQMLAELKEAFEREGAGWEISVTLPTSYWYLRGFSLENMQRQIDYFNIMSYDIHGMWDFDNKWTGPYLKGHTDWTEIDMGLDLLWRNNIKPENVVLGFGFYGRSFTVADPSCTEPNNVCQFATGGIPGSCSDTAGVLTYDEIASRNSTLDVKTFYDPETTVKYNIFGGNQWVSYDDGQSFRDKLSWLSKRCLSGLMIWAIDQDTGNWTAMGELFGDYSSTELHGLNGDSAEKLHDLFGQYTGQDCFVTPRCTDGSKGEQGPDQVCPGGTMSVDVAHNPQQRHPKPLYGDCSTGWYRHICCPVKSMPKHCEWNGEPERSEIGCSGKCGEGTFELNEDTAIDAKGTKQCYQGNRKLCCQGTKIIEDCVWSPCQGPLSGAQNPECEEGYEYQAFRYDKPDGVGLCREEYISPVDGSKGSPLMEPFKSALCCPKGRSFGKCNWANDPLPPPPPVWGDPKLYCLPQPCKADQLEIADAINPPRSSSLGGGRSEMSCDGISLPPNYDPHIGLCCEPPSTWNKDWPVDPEKLWDVHFNNPDTDRALWAYDDEYDHNDKDKQRSDNPDGTDAYGFLMLNGKKEALEDNFSNTHTVVRRTAAVPNVKREIITNNQTKVDQVFDHAEETFYVYCSYSAGSQQCEDVWAGGVEDTIIRLPSHVGEGPFARIVSMKPAGEDYALPNHHIQHRSLDGLHDNPVYELKIDYNFHLVRDDRGPVQIRVDYTNLLGYWKELTDSPHSKRSRVWGSSPAVEDDGFTMRHFRDRVNRAEEVEEQLNKKRKRQYVETTMPFEVRPAAPPDGAECSDPETQHQERRADVARRDGNVAKRWWGIFAKWLEKLTTVRKAEVGDLPLGWADEINLFKAQWGCPGKLWSANLRMDLQARVSMQATYAYYFSATFIPPTQKPDVFFYFGIQPEAELMLKLVGNAGLHWTSDRKKIIDTLGYPGLAIKGIAAVGPTLDVYGQMKGEINIHGEAKAGVTLKFDKAQAYWPQDSSDVAKYDEYLDLGLVDDPPNKPSGPELAPTFEAGVQVTADLYVIVQPEANVGIKIGGESWTGGLSLIDAQITAWVRGMIQFHAAGAISTVTKAWDYSYGAYLYYNLGYNAHATILQWATWALGERAAYSPDHKYTIYENSGSIPIGDNNAKRMVKLIDDPSQAEPFGNDTTSVNALLDPSYLFRRADDANGDVDPAIPTFTKPITCPAGSSADITIPELRFNCGAFPPLQVLDLTGQYQNMAPLCQGYKAVQGLPMTLTHAPELDVAQGKWLRKKRRKQCPNLKSDDDSCPPQTAKLHAAIGYTGKEKKLECDEFPWASSEEGGDFKPDNQRSQVCVPSAQNGLGGNCIALMSFIQQNVGKMEPSVENVDDRKDDWLYWGSQADANDRKFWYTEDYTYGSVKQRFTTYDNVQPIPAGYNDITWPTTSTKSFVFKRNYTFSIVDRGSDAASWWGATGKSFTTGSYTFSNQDPKDFSSVVCGINIFGQDTYYKNPKQGSTLPFNGLCRTNKREFKRGWEDQFVTSRCMIDFGSSLTKRSGGSRVEEDWEVKNLTVFDEELDMTNPNALVELMEREMTEAKEAEEKRRQGSVSAAGGPTLRATVPGEQSFAEEAESSTLMDEASPSLGETVEVDGLRLGLGLESFGDKM